jgi:glutaredoxin
MMMQLGKTIAQKLGLAKQAPADGSDPLAGIEFTVVEGTPTRIPLTVFALSTCGFCRRALQFMNDRGVAYRFVHVDKHPESVRKTVRAYVGKTFDAQLSFPFLCIGTERHLNGFIRPEWEALLEEVVDA